MSEGCGHPTHLAEQETIEKEAPYVSEGCGHPTHLAEQETIEEEAPHVSEGCFTQRMCSCELGCLGDRTTD